MIQKASYSYLYFILALLLICHPVATEAAFPIMPCNEAVVEHHLKQERKNHPFQSYSPTSGKQKTDDGWQGIVSFALAMATLAALVITMLANSGTVFLLTIPMSILAVVFGALGLKKRNKSFAIAGMGLGILEFCFITISIVSLVIAFS
jgi:hypothetical protein